MSKEPEETPRPQDALERIFHEPNRMAIMSTLCAAEKGLSFTEIKKTCNLTDGNLNRHLKVLSEAKAITIKKAFVNDKPRTTVSLSKLGLQKFTEYLAALEEMLRMAKAAVSDEPAKETGGLSGEFATA